MSQRPAALLRDGTRVTVRPVRSGDEQALKTFLGGLCADARQLRFFSGGVSIAKAAKAAAATSGEKYGLLAHDENGLLVGHAVFFPLDGERAEVAVEVADHLHGLGLGTILIERLAIVAEARGITHFVAEVLPENRAMLDVLRDGFGADVSLEDGVDILEFPTTAWRVAQGRFGIPS